MPNRAPLFPGGVRSPTAASIAYLTAYSTHLQLDQSGHGRWEPEVDTSITMIGCMGEEPETVLRLVSPRDRNGQRVEAIFSTLHLSLLWPHLQPLTTSFLVDRRDAIEIYGPKLALVVFSGVQRR